MIDISPTWNIALVLSTLFALPVAVVVVPPVVERWQKRGRL